jgi:hypothetical protein
MNYSFKTLSIRANGQTVGNSFLQQNDLAPNLAIVFPGAGYTTMGPMLYYTANILVERGDDVLLVEYGSTLSNPSLSPEARNQLLHEIAEAAVTEALRQRSYVRILLVGKSLGTRALSHLSEISKKWNSDEKPIRSIWLTPLLGDSGLVTQIAKLGEAQLLATGTADHPHYQASALKGLPTTVETLVIPNADHGLDIPGDVLESVRTMEELVRRIIEFVY